MKTDMQLKQDVISELSWDPSIHAATIGVQVKDGVVTLTGHVTSLGEKWSAERAAQKVNGVKALAVEMDVKLSSAYSRNDADSAIAAKNVLEWTAYWNKDTVKVMVEKGRITLTGEVEWDYQRRSAAWAVKNLLGVTGVSNQIALKPGVTSTAIKSDIDAALQRRATGDSKNISVEVRGDHVTLGGTVHSWSERDLVMHSAWGTPGVRDVVSNITIV